MATGSRFCAGLAPVRHLFLTGLLTIAVLSSFASALNYVPGSKCESVCSDQVAGTIHDDVRCLDNEFDAAPAVHLKDCVSCQLNSTAVDPQTNVTDVQWGLFHLRYTLANCMFAYPEERVSISSPCQVSCAPLAKAIEFGIPNSTNATTYSGDLGFCTGGQFDDFTINNCAFCYSFIPQQLILGNFLQALHIACHRAPAVGKSFYPDGIAIFNQSTIAGPSGSVSAPASNGLSGTKLILAIALPVVGGIAILAGVCCCCWHFTRRRRARMAASGRMSTFHEGQVQHYSPMTPRTSPPQPYAWDEPAQEMQSITVLPKMDEPTSASRHTPDLTQSRRAEHGNDELSAPLVNPNRTSYVRGDDGGAAGEVRDPNLHEQYIGGDAHSASPGGGFRAQDGFVRESTHGGWAH